MLWFNYQAIHDEDVKKIIFSSILRWSFAFRSIYTNAACLETSWKLNSREISMEKLFDKVTQSFQYLVNIERNSRNSPCASKEARERVCNGTTVVYTVHREMIDLE